MLAKCEEKGHPSAVSAAQIAATAIANGMILVTHNTDDFEIFRETGNLHMEDWEK